MGSEAWGEARLLGQGAHELRLGHVGFVMTLSLFA